MPENVTERAVSEEHKMTLPNGSEIGGAPGEGVQRSRPVIEVFDEVDDGWANRGPLIAAAPAMLALLEEVDNGMDCDFCEFRNQTHRPDCRLAAVLKAARGEA
jgi:hypothetical protein